MFNFLRNIGPTELIIIGVILIVFFGAKRIAGLGKAGGETVKEFKKIKKEFSGAVTEVNKGEDEEKDTEGGEE
jgi:sec-independent protein translocase protein TatA